MNESLPRLRALSGMRWLAAGLALQGFAELLLHIQVRASWLIYAGANLYILAELVDFFRRRAADYDALRPPSKPQTPTERSVETERTKKDR